MKGSSRLIVKVLGNVEEFVKGYGYRWYKLLKLECGHVIKRPQNGAVRAFAVCLKCMSPEVKFDFDQEGQGLFL